MSGCGDCDCDCGRGVPDVVLVPEVNPSLAYRLLNRDYLDDPR